MNRRPMPRSQPKVEPVREFRRVTLTDNVTVKELAEKLDARSRDVIQKLMERGMLATINETTNPMSPAMTKAAAMMRPMAGPMPKPWPLSPVAM